MGPSDRPLRGHRATILIIFGHDAEEWSKDHSPKPKIDFAIF
jgi:hypothetical protein